MPISSWATPLWTYSLRGYGYVRGEGRGPRKAGPSSMFEEAYNQGYPQELKHFIECVSAEDREPLISR